MQDLMNFKKINIFINTLFITFFGLISLTLIRSVINKFFDNDFSEIIAYALAWSMFLIIYFFSTERRWIIGKLNIAIFLSLPLLLLSLTLTLFIIINRYKSLYIPDINGLIFIAAITFFQSSFEEILFRGIIFEKLLDNKNLEIAMIISSLIFGVSHMYNYFIGYDILKVSIFQSLFASLFGAFLSIIYYKTHSLFGISICHCIHNFIIQIYYFNIQNANTSFYNEVIISISLIILCIIYYILFLKRKRWPKPSLISPLMYCYSFYNPIYCLRFRRMIDIISNFNCSICSKELRKDYINY